jgi:hypothetical protein
MQSPQLSVADKHIPAPVYVTRHRQADEVPNHQLHFLKNEAGEKEFFLKELFSFGEKMKRRIQSSPFHWNGLGTLRYVSDEMLFEPDPFNLQALQAVPAEKVLRENVQHHVLVGDQEMTSQQVTEVLNKVEYKRPWFIIAGWILLIVAIIAILLFLYMKNFQTTSTGLQTIW